MQQGQNSTVSVNGIICIYVNNLLFSAHACFQIFYDITLGVQQEYYWSEQDYRVIDGFSMYMA